MKLKVVLVISAIYLGILGIGIILFPRQFGAGAVPEDASPALISLLRVFGGMALGIAVMNWLARTDAEPSRARTAILCGNAVGFGCVALMDVVGVFGDTARSAAAVFLVLHLVLAGMFVYALRENHLIKRRLAEAST